MLQLSAENAVQFYMQKGQKIRGGFALPTVLIASVVMLTILSVAVTSVAAVRTNLKVQYYEQLAKVAGEAGAAYAEACLAKNNNVPLWTNEKPLTPATDCAGNQILSPTFQAMIVAGGGGGGAGIGGGGGGGGVVQVEGMAVGVGSYSVVVGAGGAGGVSKSTGSNGGNSSAAVYTAIGGGGGGGRVGTNSYTAATNGGSGGGGNGSYESSTGSGAPGAVGQSGQGNNGGMGSAGNTGSYAGNGGGGGGAGSAGGNASGDASGVGVSGNGGSGILSDISGQQVYYGSGGAGGRWGSGLVGVPGIGAGAGGSGTGVTGGAGQANTGAGGGGGSSGDGLGGAGGSGVVIVRYANNGSITATGGTVSIDGPYKVHKFTSSGTIQVTNVSNSSCPSDPRCSVTVNDTLRSSFRVARPTIHTTGKPIAIVHEGYVELLRSSNGQVWRTYTQQAVQATVVPDLCSGAATSPLGWTNAVNSSTQSSLPNASSARTITIADEPLNAGQMYFRKDFTVAQPGEYSVVSQTASTADVAEVYIDGVLRSTASNQITNGTVTLSAGCHTITARLTNKTLLPRASRFTAAVQVPGSEPIVATDSTWRVSAGSSVHYSSPDFYADPSIWIGATDYSDAQSTVSSWASTSGDPLTRLISPSCSSSCPSNSSTYFRDSKSFMLTQDTDVLISSFCDNACSVYIDGNQVMDNSSSGIGQQTVSLPAGAHHVSARLYNNVTASLMGLTLYDKTNSNVLTRTDTSWLTSRNIWVSGTNEGNDPTSYEASFRPSPSEIPEPPVYDLLVVGGGGGGGGNCNSCGGAGGGGGGGVVYQQSVVATTGSRTITIGSGGSAGAGGVNRTSGSKGGNTAFGGVIAQGGGFGGAQLGVSGGSGGSGGGGSGGGSPAAGTGGAGVNGQGFAGGTGSPGTLFAGAGGGGATGAGVNGAIGGDGGSGLITYLTGMRLVVGGGGGGGAYDVNAAGSGDAGSSGNGVNQNTNNGIGYSGVTNRGGGGGGGNGLNKGGSGGSGGSGIVVIRVKTGSMNISVSGSPNVSSTTIDGVGYTIYTYTSNGTFNILSLNS